MIKAVIFDLDGLLIDSEPIAYGILQDMVKPYGGFITLQDYTANYLGRTVRTGMHTIATDYNIPVDEEELFNLYLKLEEERVTQGIPLKKGGKELLTYLKDKGYKTIVASSSIRERAEKILRYHNISSLFDDLVFGYEVENSKPYPDIFLKACEKLGVEPDEAIVLEDSESGIQAGYSANIPVICIPDLKLPEENFLKKASFVFDSLFDVIDYLKNNN